MRNAAVVVIITAAGVTPGALAQSAPTDPACTIQGTEARDVLLGTRAADIICGLGGNDVIFARDGNDTVNGGAGDDRLLGGAGDDTIRGDAGNDILVDPSDRTVLDGGPGNDRCIGNATTTFRNCELVLPRPRARVPSQRASPSPGAAQLGAARFVPEATRAELRSDGVLVGFEEAGLHPGATSTVEVTADRTTSLRCTDPTAGGAVILETSSTASVTETGTYVADDQGRIRAERLLAATPSAAEISGYGCTTTERVTVSLHDVTTDARVTVER